VETEQCTLLVIGAGPGGYACGIRAGQLGVDTIVVDADKPGGTCLNVGCIPSKALIHAAEEYARASAFARPNALGISSAAPALDFGATMDWKDSIVLRLTGGVSTLLKKAGTRYVHGQATIIDGKTVDVDTADGIVRIVTKALVIATGSRPLELPHLPFGGRIINSTDALALRDLPKRLAVVGAGYIGLEIGTAMAKLGVEVSIIETAARILPQYDAALTAPVASRLAELGIKVYTAATALGLASDGDALEVSRESETFHVAADLILVTVGRHPAADGFGLDGLGLAMTDGCVAVDERCATSMRGVYAIGDITGQPMLAHRATAQGMMVADIVSGGTGRWDKRAVPAVCFTDPEIVTVGEFPDAQGHRKTALFPFSANGRSMTMERSDGFVRVVFDPLSDLVLGLQAVGSGVSEMAGQFALAIEMGATLIDIADTIHAHPTLGEAIQEAALKGAGRALHI
jgi:dihydrolipoamide dehydrogenase